jgi:hypothetical protein
MTASLGHDKIHDVAKRVNGAGQDMAFHQELGRCSLRPGYGV